MSICSVADGDKAAVTTSKHSNQKSPKAALSRMNKTRSLEQEKTNGTRKSNSMKLQRASQNFTSSGKEALGGVTISCESEVMAHVTVTLSRSGLFGLGFQLLYTQQHCQVHMAKECTHRSHWYLHRFGPVMALFSGIPEEGYEGS
ncbi:hypothetical protein MUG91_G321n3 [Manis pentadactyla]|nr:hypothetical protein MUG91_G321n3 [Manis pentadactyla]